jgi:hypothetical protein
MPAKHEVSDDTTRTISRRNFLKRAAVGSATIAAATLTKGAGESPTKPIEQEGHEQVSETKGRKAITTIAQETTNGREALVDVHSVKLMDLDLIDIENGGSREPVSCITIDMERALQEGFSGRLTMYWYQDTEQGPQNVGLKEFNVIEVAVLLKDSQFLIEPGNDQRLPNNTTRIAFPVFTKDQQERYGNPFRGITPIPKERLTDDTIVAFRIQSQSRSVVRLDEYGDPSLEFEGSNRAAHIHIDSTGSVWEDDTHTLQAQYGHENDHSLNRGYGDGNTT